MGPTGENEASERLSKESATNILNESQREDMEIEFRGSKCSLAARELTWAIRIRTMTTTEDVARLIDRALLRERNATLERCEEFIKEELKNRHYAKPVIARILDRIRASKEPEPV